MIWKQAIEIVDECIRKGTPEVKESPKVNILLAELYVLAGKTSKSIEIVISLLGIYPKDPYLLYYESKYLLGLSLFKPALEVANLIVHFNQYEIWILLAEIQNELKNYSQALICLNHAVKLSKFKPSKSTPETIYKPFEELGKIKHASAAVEPL